MKNDVFIDPSAVTPRQLCENEMAALSGGLPIAVIIWVTSCGEGLGAMVALTVVTVTE